MGGCRYEMPEMKKLVLIAQTTSLEIVASRNIEASLTRLQGIADAKWEKAAPEVMNGWIVLGRIDYQDSVMRFEHVTTE